jgi:hypothetical protein
MEPFEDKGVDEFGPGGVTLMSRAEEYRGYATECVRLAQLATDPENRTHLLQMAQKWRELAEKADKEPQPEG